jgi:hypothetical protein
MPEFAEAQALLAALAECDEVKSAVASRQRRLELQTRYTLWVWRASTRAIPSAPRRNLAEALRTYDSKRDRDAMFRLGVDTGAGAACILTQARWALGDVERARALSDEALARADETAQAPTRVTVNHHTSLYHLLRRDPEAVMRIATTLVDLSKEHGMALFLGLGNVYSNWARAWLGDREGGMTGLREAVAAYLGQGNKLFVPLFQGRLAELEAEG